MTSVGRSCWFVQWNRAGCGSIADIARPPPCLFPNCLQKISILSWNKPHPRMRASFRQNCCSRRTVSQESESPFHPIPRKCGIGWGAQDSWPWLSVWIGPDFFLAWGPVLLDPTSFPSHIAVLARTQEAKEVTYALNPWHSTPGNEGLLLKTPPYSCKLTSDSNSSWPPGDPASITMGLLISLLLKKRKHQKRARDTENPREELLGTLTFNS